MNKDNIILSIVCITYNHESYIRQCLEGFIMQKTNFLFEAIVHDDASTDNTANIIQEYAQNYPNIIKPVLEKENQFSKHDGSLDKILNSNIRGKYVAVCEGDDYWIDPKKIQKQVDFLESNYDYSMCFHNAVLLNESKSPFRLIEIENRDYTANECYRDWIVPTASIVIRKSVWDKMKTDTRLINGDINIILNACANGKIRGFSEKMSVYRRQDNGLTLKRAFDDNLKMHYNYVNHWKALRELYPFVSSSLYHEKMSAVYLGLSFAYARKKSWKSIPCMLRAFILHPIYLCTYIYRYGIKKCQKYIINNC